MGIKEDNALIEQIGFRAARMYNRLRRIHVSPDYIASEVGTVHNEICALRLEELLHASDEHFIHDISGIHRYLDILDGSFRQGFTPRFAR